VIRHWHLSVTKGTWCTYAKSAPRKVQDMCDTNS
jgi:hypothetical protein